MQDVARRFGLQVQHHGTLAAVDGGEVGADPLGRQWRPAAVFVAFGTFDLDHGGAEIRQYLAAIRAGENAAEIDDANPLEDFPGRVSHGSICPSGWRQAAPIEGGGPGFGARLVSRGIPHSLP
jgi:hypothetical protein